MSVPQLEESDADAARLRADATGLPEHAHRLASLPGRFDMSTDPIRNHRFGRITIHEYEGGTAAELLMRGYPQVHSQDIVLTYYGLVDVRFGEATGDTQEAVTPATAATVLGRSLSDRMYPHARGCVHEIEFSGGSLKVTAADVAASWIAINSRG